MEGFVKLIGIVIMAAGVIYFVKPTLVKKVVEFIMKDKWIYVGAILSFIIGIVFLRAASQCATPWLVILFAILALIKGILALALGKQKIKSLVDYLLKRPVKSLRVYALIDIALGVILIYAA